MGIPEAHLRCSSFPRT